MIKNVLTLSEELSLRVSENRVLRIILGPKMDKVTGEWKKLHNYLYSFTNIFRFNQSRRIKWEGHVALREEKKCMQGFCGET